MKQFPHMGNSFLLAPSGCCLIGRSHPPLGVWRARIRSKLLKIADPLVHAHVGLLQPTISAFFSALMFAVIGRDYGGDARSYR
jgi:hypothetical protein